MNKRTALLLTLSALLLAALLYACPQPPTKPQPPTQLAPSTPTPFLVPSPITRNTPTPAPTPTPFLVPSPRPRATPAAQQLPLTHTIYLPAAIDHNCGWSPKKGIAIAQPRYVSDFYQNCATLMHTWSLNCSHWSTMPCIPQLHGAEWNTDRYIECPDGLPMGTPIGPLRCGIWGSRTLHDYVTDNCPGPDNPALFLNEPDWPYPQSDLTPEEALPIWQFVTERCEARWYVGGTTHHIFFGAYPPHHPHQYGTIHNTDSWLDRFLALNDATCADPACQPYGIALHSYVHQPSTETIIQQAIDHFDAQGRSHLRYIVSEFGYPNFWPNLETRLPALLDFLESHSRIDYYFYYTTREVPIYIETPGAPTPTPHPAVIGSADLMERNELHILSPAGEIFRAHPLP